MDFWSENTLAGFWKKLKNPKLSHEDEIDKAYRGKDEGEGGGTRKNIRIIRYGYTSTGVGMGMGRICKIFKKAIKLW